MGGRHVLLLCWLVAVTVLVGCGNGGGNPPTASVSSTPSTTSKRGDTDLPAPHHDSGGGSAQFRIRGGDNSIQEFGTEAPEPQLRAAAAALHGFLDGRAERNWAAACNYLSAGVIESLQGLAGGPGEGCAPALAAFSSKVPTETLTEAAAADVGSLRSEGTRAFLIYRGAHGVVYVIPMARRGSGWKVDSLTAVPLS